MPTMRLEDSRGGAYTGSSPMPAVPSSSSLPDSRLYTFIDGPREFALYFLEGQKLIADLAVRQRIHAAGFAYFRDVVLSIQPMIALLKSGEQLGFYIDSAEPKFCIKIETGHRGATRCSLWPDGLAGLSETLRGTVRVQKIFPNDRPPYESVIEVIDLPLRELVNRVLAESYQVKSAVVVSQTSDQSAMLHQLPPLPGKDDYELSIESVRSRREEIREDLDGIFAQALHGIDAITGAFQAIGFRLLASRPVWFHCACSRRRMVRNLRLLWDRDPDGLFGEGEDVLEITCEYCKEQYRISRRDLTTTPETVH